MQAETQIQIGRPGEGRSEGERCGGGQPVVVVVAWQEVVAVDAVVGTGNERRTTRGMMWLLLWLVGGTMRRQDVGQRVEGMADAADVTSRSVGNLGDAEELLQQLVGILVLVMEEMAARTVRAKPFGVVRSAQFRLVLGMTVQISQFGAA